MNGLKKPASARLNVPRKNLCTNSTRILFSLHTTKGCGKRLGCGCARSPGGDSAPSRVKPALLLACPAYFEQRLSPWDSMVHLVPIQSPEADFRY